jgi:hypothetical protein
LPKLGSVQSFSRAASAMARASWAPVLVDIGSSPQRALTGLGFNRRFAIASPATP